MPIMRSLEGKVQFMTESILICIRAALRLTVDPLKFREEVVRLLNLLSILSWRVFQVFDCRLPVDVGSD